MSKRKLRSPLSAGEKREVWGGFADREDEYLDEVEQRWGDTDQYAASARRVAAYSQSAWEPRPVRPGLVSS